MKKFILLILMTLAAFTAGAKTFAASAVTKKITSYEEVTRSDIKYGSEFLIKCHFDDEYDRVRFEDDDYAGDLKTGYLDKNTVIGELSSIGYEASADILNMINQCHYTETNINIFYLLVPSFDYNLTPEYTEYAQVYRLTISELPQITSEEVHKINYDSLLSLAEIKARYTARDNYDKDITSKIKFETNYPNDKSNVKIGEYYITARVSDSSNNEASVTNKIIVEDTTAPKFTGTLSYVVQYGESFTTANIINGLSCNDNYEKVIPSSKFKITGDKQYNPEQLGDQNFEVSYTDGSGNRGSCSVKVTVVDNEAPIITVIDTVKISPANRLNEEEILKILRSSNKISSDYLEASIESDYFDATEEGIYTSLCRVKEKDGSVNLYRFKIDLNSNNAMEATDNTNLWIIVGVSGGLLLIGGGVGLFFYIKRKRELMQL